jgi:hypothetical protein
MKRVLSIVATSLLVASIASTTAMADPVKGQKLFLKKLKKDCGFNGAVMTAKHTQSEWEELKEGGKLEDEIKTLCPNVKDVKDKYIPDLFDFFYEFGSDSGNVPAC